MTSLSPVSTPRAPVPGLSPRSDDLHYSVRRYYVDEFFTRRAAELAPGSRVIDIGGIKGRKRGQFDIAAWGFDLVCVNTSPAASPDILGDATSVPLPTGEADAVILSEVIEHLPDPAAALREAARLLRPGGVMLATAPFLFRVHPDPIDVGRYTPDWWQANVASAGLGEITIERQGLFFSVMAEFIRGWVKHLTDTRTLWPGMESLAPGWVRTIREQAISWDARPATRECAYYQSFTTGYGVRAVKP